jgi:NADH-quinone oxidoreductase subunit H
MASLYFGGYNFPFQHEIANLLHINDTLGFTILQTMLFFGKIIFFIFFFMWIRWTIPRFRYDQLMNLGWKALLPLAIVNIMVTGIVMWATGQLN